MLNKDEHTWRMIHREAIANEYRVEMKIRALQRRCPAATVTTVNDQAEFTLTGGLGYVLLAFTDLSSPRGHSLLLDD